MALLVKKIFFVNTPMLSMYNNYVKCWAVPNLSVKKQLTAFLTLEKSRRSVLGESIAFPKSVSSNILRRECLLTIMIPMRKRKILNNPVNNVIVNRIFVLFDSRKGEQLCEQR